MQIYHLVRGRAPQRLESLERLPDDGYVWLDCVRGAVQGWEDAPRRLLGVEVDRRHVLDGNDAEHGSYFDVAPGYDLLVLQEVAPPAAGGERGVFEVRSAALLLSERLLVTVRAPDSPAFAALARGFATGTIRAPGSVRVLAHILLDFMNETLLAVSDPFIRRLDDLQEKLLDPRNPLNDWQLLLAGRRDLRSIEHLCEGQLKALGRWRRRSQFEWPNPEETRLHDVCELIARVQHAAADLERHIESAVQIYFASISHRTNDIVRTLTVFSAIFLPLTFIAGIYGMNFQNMPELQAALGYPLLLLFMLMVAVGLLLYFRRRGYF